MEYTPDELLKAKQIKAQGGTENDARIAIAEMRAKVAPVKPIRAGYVSYSGEETGEDIMQTIKGIGKTWGEAGQNIVTRLENTDPDNLAENFRQGIGIGGDIMRGIGRTFGEIYIGGAKIATSGAMEEDVADAVMTAAKGVITSDFGQAVIDKYESLNPETKDNVNIALGYLEGLTELVPAVTASRLARLATTSRAPLTVSQVIDDALRPATKIDDITRTAKKVAGKLDDALPTKAKGVLETGREVYRTLIENPIKNVQRHIDDAASRAEMFARSTPEVETALKAGVPDSLVNLRGQMDELTVDASKEMVKIAGGQGGRGARTTIVPATEYGKVYQVVENQRKAVGKAIGEAVDNLPVKEVNMKPAFDKVDDILRANYVDVTDGTLDFSKSGFTPKQEALARNAYETMRSAGDVVDARVVHNRDRVFSSLAREAKNTPDVAPLIVKVDGEDKYLLDIMRDTYRNPLNEISPQIKVLNKQYAFYRNLVDASDDTITKMAKAAGIEIDPTQQASVTLRRLDTDAMSAPVFREVVDRMSIAARELGHRGPDIPQLVFFSNELKPLYTTPQAVTQGGFTGSIRSAIGTKIADLATPDMRDAQEALVKLLDAVPQPKNIVQSSAVNIQRSALARGEKDIASKIARMKIDDIANVEQLKTRLAEVLTPDEMNFPDLQNHIKTAEAYMRESQGKIVQKSVSYIDDITKGGDDAIKKGADAEMVKRLTKERGAIGTPSDEFLLASAKRELLKKPDDVALKAFIAEKQMALGQANIETVASKLLPEQHKIVREIAEKNITHKNGIPALKPAEVKILRELKRMGADVPPIVVDIAQEKPSTLIRDYMREIVEIAETKGYYKPIPVE